MGIPSDMQQRKEHDMKPVKLAMICEECFNVKHNAITVSCKSAVDHGSIDVPIIAKCSKCKNDYSYFFSLDNGIADTISYLNKLGYITEYSCQGHARCCLAEDGRTLSVHYELPYFLIDLNKSKIPLNTELLRICKKLKFSEVDYSTLGGYLLDGNFDLVKYTTADALKELNGVSRVSFTLQEQLVDVSIHNTFSIHPKQINTPEMVDLANRNLDVLFSVKCQMLTDELKSSFGKKKAN